MFAHYHRTPTGIQRQFLAVDKARITSYNVCYTKLLRKPHGETILVVDAITALGVFDIKTDEWGIDVVVTGSQKALMLPPGLAFVSVSEKAWQLAEKAKNSSFYFNLKKERENQQKNQTAYTPAVSLIVGLQEVLKMLKAEGLDAVFGRNNFV